MADGTRSVVRASDEVNQKLAQHEDQLSSMSTMLSDIVRRLDSLLPAPPPARPPDLPEDGEVSQLQPAVVIDESVPRKPRFGNNRNIKVDMPRFNGDNPTGWLFRVEQFFSFYEMSETQRFTVASIYMDGPALEWFQWMHTNAQLSTWQSFKEGLLERFGPSPYRDLKGELFKLLQHTTVQAYHNEFESLSNRVSDVTPASLLSCFISGLRRDIQREVRAFQPTSLPQAIQLAKLMEDRINDVPDLSLLSSPMYTRRQTNPNHQPISAPALAASPTLPLLPAPPSISPEPSKPQIPILQLTPTQMAERKAKGLCFNCDEKFNRGYVCKAHIFFLLANNEDSGGSSEASTDSEPFDYG